MSDCPDPEVETPMADSSDHELARDLAAAAGQRLLALRADGGSGPPERLREAGDRTSQEFLGAELARLRRADSVLSEEAADDRSRLGAERVWIIDPLDGTREFGEPGRTDWAVHVALWERTAAAAGAPGLTAGAVALPALGRTLSTADPPRPGSRPAQATSGPAVPPGQATDGRGTADRLRIVVSRTRAPAFLTPLADRLGADLIPLGSAGAKAAAVITGEADAYVHDGGQHEWDSAAPVAVALAAGLHASRIDGSPLRYNREPSELPDILICPLPLANRLLNAIGETRR
jgi:3'(2'), 5'-bisphosphate nucleotidase